jgi:hypothetical protein
MSPNSLSHLFPKMVYFSLLNYTGITQSLFADYYGC